MLTGVDRSCHTQASEYKLLPHLFAQGVLCRVRYLTIEWHLGWLKERQQDWLSGMALRLGLDKMLTDAVRLPRRRSDATAALTTRMPLPLLAVRCQCPCGDRARGLRAKQRLEPAACRL